MCGEPDPTSANLPEEELLARERQQQVERALAKLSPKLREVLILRSTGDMSYRDIAATLHLRMGTVKSRIFAGLEKMSRLMEAKTS